MKYDVIETPKMKKSTLTDAADKKEEQAAFKEAHNGAIKKWEKLEEQAAFKKAQQRQLVRGDSDAAGDGINNTSSAQCGREITCECCGNPGHRWWSCNVKNKMPKEYWYDPSSYPNEEIDKERRTRGPPFRVEVMDHVKRKRTRLGLV